MRSKVAAGSTFPQRIVQLADAATFSYKQDGHCLTHAEAVAFLPSCLCMFFITAAGNTETRPACRHTRYSQPVLCLYRTFSVYGRRGSKRSLVRKKKKQKIYCVQNAARFKKGSRKMHDAWRTREATLRLLVALVISSQIDELFLQHTFTSCLYLVFLSFCFRTASNVYFQTVGTGNYTNATTL